MPKKKSEDIGVITPGRRLQSWHHEVVFDKAGLHTLSVDGEELLKITLPAPQSGKNFKILISVTGTEE